MAEKFNIAAVAYTLLGSTGPDSGEEVEETLLPDYAIILALVTDESGVPVKGLTSLNFGALVYGCPVAAGWCGLVNMPVAHVETRQDAPFYVIRINGDRERGVDFSRPSNLIALTVGIEQLPLPWLPGKGEGEKHLGVFIPAGYTVINCSRGDVLPKVL